MFRDCPSLIPCVAASTTTMVGVTTAVSAAQKQRGYLVPQISIALSVDMAEMMATCSLIASVHVLSHGIRQLHFSCTGPIIQKVFINDSPVEFSYRNVDRNFVSEHKRRDLVAFIKSYRQESIKSQENCDLSIYLPSSPMLGVTLKLKIEYTLESETSSLRFDCGGPGAPHYDRVMFVADESYSFTKPSGWFPCLDNLFDRSMFDLECTIAVPYIGVATGSLIEHELLGGSLNRFKYRCDIPLLACDVSMVAGWLLAYPDPDIPHRVTHFVRRPAPSAFARDISIEDCLMHTVRAFKDLVRFVETFLGVSIPFTCYNQVFLECQGYEEVASTNGSLAVFVSPMLHSAREIDPTIKIRRALAISFLKQWFGSFIVPEDAADIWMLEGLAGYVADLYMVDLVGHNEHKLKCMKDVSILAMIDTGEWPLYRSGDYLHRREVYNTLTSIKAPFVMHLLEHRIGPETLKRVITEIVSEGVDSTNSPMGASVSTSLFIRTIKRVSGRDLTSFYDYIYFAGIPRMTIAYSFDKRKNKSELAIRQDQVLQGGRCFRGDMAVRVHEIDGLQDFAFSIDDYFQVAELPCNSKLRKMRRKKGEELIVPELPVLFLRIDPEFRWLRTIDLRSTFPFFYRNQLLSDKDVQAQYEALCGIRNDYWRKPGALINHKEAKHLIEAIKKIFINSHVFYRIRMEAALTLATIESPKHSPEMGEFLISYFKKWYYDQHSGSLLPNDFEDLTLYYLKRAIISALALIRRPFADDRVALANVSKTYTPPNIVLFLLDILKSNDNGGNSYSDAFYIADVITAILSIKVTNTKHLIDIITEVVRYLSIERIDPSYHDVVSQACLSVIAGLMTPPRSIISPNPDIFSEFAQMIDGPCHATFRIAAILGWAQVGLVLGDYSALTYVQSLAKSHQKSDRCIADVCLRSFTIVISKDTRAMFRLRNDQNETLVHRFWAILITTRDEDVRFAVYHFYKYIWGLGTPACVDVNLEEMMVDVDDELRQITDDIKECNRLGAGEPEEDLIVLDDDDDDDDDDNGGNSSDGKDSDDEDGDQIDLLLGKKKRREMPKDRSTPPLRGRGGGHRGPSQPSPPNAAANKGGRGGQGPKTEPVVKGRVRRFMTYGSDSNESEEGVSDGDVRRDGRNDNSRSKAGPVTDDFDEMLDDYDEDGYYESDDYNNDDYDDGENEDVLLKITKTGVETQILQRTKSLKLLIEDDEDDEMDSKSAYDGGGMPQVLEAESTDAATVLSLKPPTVASEGMKVESKSGEKKAKKEKKEKKDKKERKAMKKAKKEEKRRKEKSGSDDEKNKQTMASSIHINPPPPIHDNFDEEMPQLTIKLSFAPATSAVPSTVGRRTLKVSYSNSQLGSSFDLQHGGKLPE